MKKLKWSTDLNAKHTLWEKHTSGENFEFEIDVVHHREKKKTQYRYYYRLRIKDRFIGLFKKLSTAKKVAQLIHNG